jgi:hypothetical protein
MASLKSRLAKLELFSKARTKKAEPPQELSEKDHYLWLIGQPASRAPAHSKYSPEQAYLIISRGVQ